VYINGVVLASALGSFTLLHTSSRLFGPITQAHNIGAVDSGRGQDALSRSTTENLMTRSIRVALTAGLFALSLGGVAIAGGGGFGGHGFHELIRSLNLTEDQKTLAMELREEGRADHEANKANKDAIVEAMMLELEKPQPDTKKVHDLIDDMLDQKREEAHERADAVLELHATFSDDQRAAFVDGMRDLKDEHEARREDHEGGPPEGHGGKGGKGGKGR
jgi:Spy/CpxP family protein refolding chaperone